MKNDGLQKILANFEQNGRGLQGLPMPDILKILEPKK